MVELIVTMHASRWVCPIIVAMAAVAAAQVPLNKDPRHRVVYDNSELLILDVHVPVGGSTLDHAHDRDIVTVRWLRGVAFVDSGTVFEEATGVRFRELVGSAGIGVRVVTPFVPAQSGLRKDDLEHAGLRHRAMGLRNRADVLSQRF